MPGLPWTAARRRRGASSATSRPSGRAERARAAPWCRAPSWARPTLRGASGRPDRANGTGEHAHWLWGEEGGLSARAAHARYGIWAKVPLARHEVHKGPGEGVVHAVRADEAGGIVGGALRASSKHRVSTDKGRERARRVPRRVPTCEMKSWFSAAFM